MSSKKALHPLEKKLLHLVGKANEVAATAAHTLATAAAVNYNPLFIHGGTGRG